MDQNLLQRYSNSIFFIPNAFSSLSQQNGEIQSDPTRLVRAWAFPLVQDGGDEREVRGDEAQAIY